ncbi:MAG: ClpP family protease [Promethearchaeota archaeon]|jgi:ATP-dependent Clp protease protease subunit
MLALIISSLIGITPTFEHSGSKDLVTSKNEVRMPQVVYVHGKITESTAKNFAASMNSAKKTGQPIIPIVISSYGGSVYALLEMIDTIKNIGVPVATIVTGKAMSAGGVLASCGDEGMRFALPNATFMIHEVSSATWGKLSELKIDVKEADRLNKAILEIMATNVGKSPDYFINLIHARGHTDWYFDAKTAKKHGLINHVGLPKIEVKVDVHMTIK